MKLQAETGDEKHQIEIKRNCDKVLADVDGRKYELEVSEPEPNVFLIKNGNEVHEVFVSPQTNPNEPTRVRIGPDEVDIKLIDPKRLRGSAGTSDHADGLAEIKTAMPGKVVRILLEPGAAVEKGDPVLVVEAMKMQNDLKSPKSGIVKEIRVAEGSTVSARDVLATIE